MTLYRSVCTAIVLSLLVFPACDSSPNEVEAEITILDVSIGDGDEILPGHTIIVEYVGKLEDGTIFDSSDIQEENLIFTLGVNNVIEGLDEGIPGMKVGGVRQIEIPSQKAFGRNGMCISDGSCPVPPNATVIFDITIVDILDYVLIEDVTIGSGNLALVGSLVEIEYVGVLQDGRLIASSSASGSLSVILGDGSVIDGLEIGVQEMRVGGVRRLTIPPILAYGSLGDAFGTIPPYATLYYRVELVRSEG